MWQQVKSEEQPLIDDMFKEDLKVYYITGPSGIGKSLCAIQTAKKMGYKGGDMVSYKNGFYIGVTDGEGVCIYDDWRPSHMEASEFINFIDYHIHPMNIKGGSVKNKYKLIIITSIIRPEDIYRNVPAESKVQWMRRMEVIDMWPKGSDKNNDDPLVWVDD